MPDDFHDIRFPLDVALAASGGPEWRTDVVVLGSGHEHRNARWAHSRRRYDAGYGVKSLDSLAAVLTFFEERRGRLFGFRWHDRLDGKSCVPSGVPQPTDQVIGEGDGERVAFQLVKTYGAVHDPYERRITKPLAGSVRVAIDGVEQPAETFTCDAATGLVTFAAPPEAGQVVTAGFAFDVPVRFDIDRLEVDLAAFTAGGIPKIPLVELID
ncbi:conserved hypothetical protein [Hyphomicrobiales bacterium]|nr:conserved hypothetical protein [Hyphomicrobiales bacterium]CAH1669676.1 conserved hypothetical protein [Hyphomicrobiales bacterium]